MFVTGLLEDWMRKLEEGRRCRREQDLFNSPQRYQAFLESQKEIWTPPELFEKCCPRFLAGGNQRQLSQYMDNGDRQGNVEEFQSIRLKDGTYTCKGGCHKAHPTITLFFDAEQNQTIAILSHRLDPFLQYLQHRVNEGTAVCKTPYYYELKGFVRENWNHAREHHNLFGRHLVKVATGALNESDNVQRAILEQQHRQRLQRQHAGGQSFSFDQLEEVLNICSLYRLSDDLDVLSIEAMRQTSRMFRKVAIPMAQQRLKDTELVVTPMVDGFYVAGYSVFRRSNPARRTVTEREQGRQVEYAVVRPSISCRPPKRKRSLQHKLPPQESEQLVVRFIPYTNKQQGASPAAGMDSKSSVGEFSWGCEELSFANLEREWGDIGVTEYTGQKVIVHWRRNIADIVDDARLPVVQNRAGTDVPIFDLRISSATQEAKKKVFSTSGFSLTLDLTKMTTTQVDDVTVLFEGSAKILECAASFDFLVKSYARCFEPALRSRYEQIQKTRPLLRHERSMLQRVETIATTRQQL